MILALDFSDAVEKTETELAVAEWEAQGVQLCEPQDNSRGNIRCVLPTNYLNSKPFMHILV